METYVFLCCLVVCSVLREAFTCQDQDVALISQELKSVSDWKGLASWLGMESNAIETDCAGEGSKAACYRRKLVRSYCDYQPCGDPYKVAEDIAVALEKMKHKRQAENLRQLQFDTGRGTVERERDKQASGAESVLAKEPLQEPTVSPPLPEKEATSETSLRGVQVNIKKLRDKFKTLKRVTQVQLEGANIQINDLVEVIYSLLTENRELHQDFLNKFVDGFVESATISAVFRRLDTHKYWGYLNIDILEHIITEFTLPSQTQLEGYKKQQQQFMEQTTVEQFCKAVGDRQPIDPSPAFVKLISQEVCTQI